MKDEKSTPLNPSRPPLVREGAGAQASSPVKEKGRAGTQTPSPDKGRAGEAFGFIPYNKKLTALARENRRNPTAAESKIWNGVLRMRHFADYKFLRQKPIGNFIVDFYRSSLRLAIEIDGNTHAEAAEYDAGRTNDLEAFGITVVRYTNDEVLENLPGVYEDLMRKIASLDEGYPQ